MAKANQHNNPAYVSAILSIERIQLLPPWLGTTVYVLAADK